MYQCAHKAPAVSTIEEDVDHSTVYVADLAAVRPKFYVRKQRHSFAQHIFEGHIKVPTSTATSVEGVYTQVHFILISRTEMHISSHHKVYCPLGSL